MVKLKVSLWCIDELGFIRTHDSLLRGVAFVSWSWVAHIVQITVRNAPLPTWHRGSVSDWFAGTRTRSSCCGSSSALVGHGFWPQIERNLGMKTKVAYLVLCRQKVRNAAHPRQPFTSVASSFAKQQEGAQLKKVECSGFTSYHLLADIQKTKRTNHLHPKT